MITIEPAVARAIAFDNVHPLLVRDPWGDPTPPAHLAPEADARRAEGAGHQLSTRAKIARLIAPEAWQEADASLKKADQVLAMLEGRKMET